MNIYPLLASTGEILFLKWKDMRNKYLSIMYYKKGNNSKGSKEERKRKFDPFSRSINVTTPMDLLLTGEISIRRWKESYPCREVLAHRIKVLSQMWSHYPRKDEIESEIVVRISSPYYRDKQEIIEFINETIVPTWHIYMEGRMIFIEFGIENFSVQLISLVSYIFDRDIYVPEPSIDGIIKEILKGTSQITANRHSVPFLNAFAVHLISKGEIINFYESTIYNGVANFLISKRPDTSNTSFTSEEEVFIQTYY